MRKIILTLFLLTLFVGNQVFAQKQGISERRQKQMQVEKKIEKFIQNNLKSVDVTSYEEHFQQRLEAASPETREELNSVSYQQRILSYKKHFLRKKYFKQYITTKERQAFVPIPASICAGGSFETGQFGSMYVGYEGHYNSGGPSSVPTVPSPDPFGFSQATLGSNANQFLIVSNNYIDPEIGNISNFNPTNGSSFAVRINAPDPCYPNGGVNKLTKAIQLQQSGNQTITFDYALVAESPQHNPTPANPNLPFENPFFVARVVDENGYELGRIQKVSNPSNYTFSQEFNSPNGCTSTKILFLDWTCGQIQINGNAGDIVYLDFIVSDCGQTAHFGYAYVDNICTGTCSNNNGMGSIQLDDGEPCQILPFNVTGTFIPPIFNGQTGILNSLTLELLHNNSSAGSITGTPSINGNTFSFLIDNNTLPNLSGYPSSAGFDFKVVAEFGFTNNTTTALTDFHTIPNQNNDYFPNPVLPSADFDASINSNGNIVITNFNNNSGTNEWYVLNSPNQNGGPYTPVTSDVNNNQGFVLYSNAQSGIYYTIIHRVNTSCGAKCVSKVYYYNESLTSLQGEKTSDCCLAFEFWPNGPGAPSDFTGEFDIGFNANGTIYTANVHNYPNNTDVSNKWKLYSSINPSGGPYVLVDTASGLTYSYSNAQDNLYYFLIHTVESSCAKVCYLQSISRNPAGKVKTNFSPLQGEVVCSIFEEDLCKAPQNIDACTDNTKEIQIQWDPTDNTGGYFVVIYWNDPSCGPSNGGSISQFQVSTNSFYLVVGNNYPSFDSYSVKIGTICGDNVFWSEVICSCMEQSKDRNINIYPNPANGIIHISFKAKKYKLTEITVLNVQGTKKAKISVNPYKKNKTTFSWNTKKLGKPGIYFVHFHTQEGEKFIKKLIVK